MTSTSSTTAPQRGFTLRSFIVCIVSMFILAMWIEYEELYCGGGPLAENSPPNGVVGVICLVLGISALLYRFRKPLRLVTAELVVVYAALLLAAPLMTQGLWHRFFGLIAAIPHHQDFKSYQSLPPMLTPHGPNLVKSASDAPIVLNNNGSKEFTIGRSAGLVPGERFQFSALVKVTGLTKGSAFYINMRADDGQEHPLLIRGDVTAPTFALQDGYARIGVSPVAIPDDLHEKLTFTIGLKGEGELAIRQVEFINVEAIESAYTGRQVVRVSDLDALPDNQRNSTVVRPDNLMSLAGLKYLLTGYIPLKQWALPAMAWSALIAGLFIGFLGVNVVMRKQWVDYERFTFPLTILPKHLFETDPGGRLQILRSRTMWIGFAIGLPLASLKGLHFYFPAAPSFATSSVYFSTYVTNPLLKAYLANVGIGLGYAFGLSFGILAIALLIETDILFSLWSMFLITQLFNLAGAAFTLKRYSGYPWEFQQAMGGFIMYAILAIFVGRHHLMTVMRVVAGRAPQPDREVMSYRWAVGLIVLSFVAIMCWGIWTQMGALAALLFFGYMFICGVAASKMRAECGAPFAYMTPYYGMQFVAAIGGFALFKSTGMLVATIAAGFMCTSCFLLIAPAQVEMMQLGRHFNVRPRDIGGGLVMGLVGGLFIGGFVLLCWAYGFGATNLKIPFTYEQNFYFNPYRESEMNADRAFNSKTLGTSPQTAPLNVMENPDAKGMAIGAGITLVLAVLRANFMWFPFHPIGYVLANSFMMRNIWFTCFLAWLARTVLFRIGGAQTIRRGLVPFCVGLFLACLLSIVIFDAVGVSLRMQGARDVYSTIP